MTELNLPISYNPPSGPGTGTPTTKEEKRLHVQSLTEQFGVAIVTNMADLERQPQAPPGANIIPGAAYVRYSSNMQDDSFSLEAQIRQIIESARQDGLEITTIFADLAESAYHKKNRPALNAAMTAARRGQFRCLYIHKVDRIARRVDWFLEIVRDLTEMDIDLKAVEQNFDLNTPEGRLIARLLSVLAEFYSENLSKETNKGKLESSRQGYHNGTPPWGYKREIVGNRKVGVPDPELVPIVRELYERYASGLYSDFQLTDWLNDQNCRTPKGNPFGKDTVRDILRNPYYIGLVRYKGMSVRKKGMSYRSTPAILSPGQHEAIISQDLWDRCCLVRSGRARQRQTGQRTARVHLMQGIIVCSECGRRLRAQTPKNYPSYYREDSHLRGFRDCSRSGRGVKGAIVDQQITNLIQSLRLPENWEQAVRQLLQKQDNGLDIEAKRREIRSQLRLMRENFERNLYEGEEYIYWQKVELLQQELELLKRTSDNVMGQAADTLLNIGESWEWATAEERRDLVRMMFMEVGCDVLSQSIQWVRVRPDFDILFRLLDGLTLDGQQRYWLPASFPQKGQ